jgi:hypothetical protein
MVSLEKIAAPFLAVAAPFMLTANAGALADECTKAPAAAPAQSSLLSNPPPDRAYLTKFSEPVLIADASPAVAQAQPANCPPPRTILDVINDQGRLVREGQRRLTDEFNRLPTPPGG